VVVARAGGGDPFEADAFTAAIHEAGIPVTARMAHGGTVDSITAAGRYWEVLVPADQVQKAAEVMARRREELAAAEPEAAEAAEAEAEAAGGEGGGSGQPRAASRLTGSSSHSPSTGHSELALRSTKAHRLVGDAVEELPCRRGAGTCRGLLPTKPRCETSVASRPVARTTAKTIVPVGSRGAPPLPTAGSSREAADGTRSRGRRLHADGPLLPPLAVTNFYWATASRRL
jgi:hypothetical protein